MCAQTLTCRAVTREEIPRSAQIVWEAFNQFAEQAGLPKTPDVQVVIDRLTEYVDDPGIPGVLYGGFLQEEQVGFFMLRKLGMDEEAWEISMLSVLPAYQRRGYGAYLVEFAQQEVLRANGVLFVCAVTEGSEKVLGLFAKQGFESEASGIPVGENLSIWMLRKDLKNAAAAESVRKEAEADAVEMLGCALSKCDGCAGHCSDAKE